MARKHRLTICVNMETTGFTVEGNSDAFNVLVKRIIEGHRQEMAELIKKMERIQGKAVPAKIPNIKPGPFAKFRRLTKLPLNKV